MPKINGYNLPDDLHYNEHNLWTKKSSDGIYYQVGISDFAQANLDKITYVEIVLEIEEDVKYNRPFGALMAGGKGSITLYSPLSGIIVEINDKLDDNPSLIKTDCYGDGWILKLKPTHLVEDLAKLMEGGSEQFQKWQIEEIDRVNKINAELQAK